MDVVMSRDHEAYIATPCDIIVCLYKTLVNSIPIEM